MHNHTYNQIQRGPFDALSIKNIVIVAGVCIVLFANSASSTASFYTSLTSSSENSFSAGVWDAAPPQNDAAPAVVVSPETSFTVVSDQTDPPADTPAPDDSDVQPMVTPVVNLGAPTITITDSPDTSSDDTQSGQ